MVDVVFSVGRVIGALFLVVLNGFFVASEFAYVRVRSTAVEGLVDEGAAGAESLQNAVNNLDDYLATTQLGITIASLGLGWIGEPAIADLLEPVLAPLLSESLLHLVSFAVGFGVITFLHVVFGELAPKTIAIARAERMALLVSPFMRMFYYLFIPGIVVFNGTANFFTRLIGIPPASETEETLSEEEILMVLTRSGQKGEVNAAEVEMVERVFQFDDITAREVMVPRPDVVTVPADLPLADLRALIADEKHTRYPVLDAEDDDRVVGFVDAKDVLAAVEEGGSADRTAADLARDVVLVPETATGDELLTAFQEREGQMAVVIDEWGGFEGIATTEDVVEVIVGDLRDQFDVAGGEPTIDRRGDGTYAVDGGVPIAAVNDRLGTTLESDEFGTIGGFVLDELGRAPETGDRIEADGAEVTVEAVDGARVERVLVRPTEDAAGGDELGELGGDEPEDGDGRGE
ncbi:hemolysin family protein [Halomicrobium salinisoli]|uniref:hemolysin family protein n=1 Tax=Halomicrobium salinisoli TaxID=2878391 RepID=UPI001CF04EF7|nr:hemolysin family protein [Halomicrobium salinisoli]